MAKKTTKTVKEEKRTFGVVFGGNLNVRKEAKKDAEIVKLLKNGEKIEILGEKGSFYKIDGGYCMKSFVEVEEA